MPEASRSERIARVVREYDAQGHHRTGTAVDETSAGWLRDLLAEAGVEASLEAYPFRRFVPLEASLVAGGQQFSGLPAFDSALTGFGGVSGRLGPVGSESEIGVVAAPPGNAADDLERARRTGAHLAIVHITTGGQPGLAPRNAAAYPSGYGPPVLQVSSEHREAIESLARRHAPAHLVATGQYEETTAANVIASIRGADSALPPLAVMTPRSGWWQCASERGGGIACWVEIARELQRRPLRRDAFFVATTAHELGYWGLERYLERRPGLAEAARLWLHLGASVGAAIAPRRLLFASEEELAARARRALIEAAGPEITVAPAGSRPGGESGNIHDRSGRYVSFLGGSAVFHLEADRWPAAIDTGVVAAYSDACLRILREADNGHD